MRRPNQGTRRPGHRTDEGVTTRGEAMGPPNQTTRRSPQKRDDEAIPKDEPIRPPSEAALRSRLPGDNTVTPEDELMRPPTQAAPIKRPEILEPSVDPKLMIVIGAEPNDPAPFLA